MDHPIPAGSGHMLDRHDRSRFWPHVSFNGGSAHLADALAHAVGECWVWNANTATNDYGRFKIAGRWQAAHRVSFQDFGHELTADLELDHLCRNKKCVNPDHLEPVTHALNVQRGGASHKTHCVQGHELTAENVKLITLKAGNSYRQCISCKRTWKRRAYLASKRTA